RATAGAPRAPAGWPASAQPPSGSLVCWGRRSAGRGRRQRSGPVGGLVPLLPKAGRPQAFWAWARAPVRAAVAPPPPAPRGPRRPVAPVAGGDTRRPGHPAGPAAGGAAPGQGLTGGAPGEAPAVLGTGGALRPRGDAVPGPPRHQTRVGVRPPLPGYRPGGG